MQMLKIDGKDYKLSKPITKDVLDLADWAKKQKQDDIQASYFAIAQSIVIGLKATYKSLRWYQIFSKIKYHKFLNDYAVKYVLENTPHDELIKMNETNKKKVPQKGNH